MKKYFGLILQKKHNCQVRNEAYRTPVANYTDADTLNHSNRLGQFELIIKH